MTKHLKYHLSIFSLLIAQNPLLTNTPILKLQQNFESVNAWEYLDIDEDGKTCRVSLNKQKLLGLLSENPKLGDLKNSDNFISFPTVDGKLKIFKMFYSPVMPIRLMKKFPDIKTFTGIGLENPRERVSVTVSDNGVKAMIMGSDKNIFIDPLKEYPDLYRVSYDEIGFQLNNQYSGCGDDDVIMMVHPLENNQNRNDFPDCVGEAQPCYTIGDTLVTYRFAGIITAEANNEIADGTVAGGLAWLNAMVNQINLLWVRELSFCLELIENNDVLIYTDNNPTPADFTAYDMYVELPLVLDHITEVIGPGGYNTPAGSLMWEYGAVFNTGYGGGLAYVPGSTSANLPSYSIFNHEIGHNLGSAHNCSTEGGWRSTIGGSIMCWRGSTIPGSSGDQYTSHTIDIAIKYQQEMYWSSGYYYQRGWIRTPTGNVPPTVSVPDGGFTIPKETPFVLDGNSNDTDIDNLTFSWEQNDVSDVAFESPNFPEATGPLFCSVDGTVDGHKRYFPNMGALLENQYDMPLTPTDDYIIEKLPFSEREINMRLLVRDNDLYSGGYRYANVQFFVANGAGPFRVTSQTEALVWETGTNETVTWDVANTSNPDGVNCQNVDIYLSLDGGESYNILLAEATQNDGFEDIFVPSVPTNHSCRIMVKSTDNIFFDINNIFFTINNSSVPELSIDTTEIILNLPIDTVITVEREISNIGEEGSILSYDLIFEYELDGNGFLSFDGSDDYVDLGTNLLSGAGNFSISLWIKALGTEQVIIQQRNGGYNGEYQLQVNGSGKLHFWTYSDGYQWSLTTPESINDDSWHHVVIVQDVEFGGGRIYVDGTESASNSDGLVNLDGTIHTYLGADMRDYSDYLSGSIDDIGIFVGILTENDILVLVNAGQGFNLSYNHDGFNGSDYLVAFYPMELMTGTVLHDASNNGSNGFISGAVWAGDLIPTSEWLSVYSSNTWLGSGYSEELDISVNTSELSVNNYYNGNVIVISNDETVVLPINMHITDALGTDNSTTVKDYKLYAAYPNPFNPYTELRFFIPKAQQVRLIVYDILGNAVKEIVHSSLDAGYHNYEWHGKNQIGSQVGAGMYFYRIDTGSFTKTKKMILLK